MSDINQNHKGKILQIVRTIKYWNRRAKMPSIPSYLLENLVLNYFDKQDHISDWIDINMINFWDYLKNAIYNSVPDPKGFQEDLNTIDFFDRINISQKAKETYEAAMLAYHYENQEKNQAKAINQWRKILGEEFPTYG